MQSARIHIFSKAMSGVIGPFSKCTVKPKEGAERGGMVTTLCGLNINSDPLPIRESNLIQC